jgi:hypothetical protein
MQWNFRPRVSVGEDGEDTEGKIGKPENPLPERLRGQRAKIGKIALFTSSPMKILYQSGFAAKKGKMILNLASLRGAGCWVAPAEVYLHLPLSPLEKLKKIGEDEGKMDWQKGEDGLRPALGDTRKIQNPRSLVDCAGFCWQCVCCF